MMLLARSCRPPRRPRPISACCAHLGPEHKVDRPDLAIYSQAEQVALGAPPTWDSPDIVTNSWGPFRLNAEAQVVVRNRSGVATAANALVNFSISSFGIGFPRTLVASHKLTLGPGQQVSMNFPLAQAILSGDPRAGVFIDLEHPHDTEPLSNHGEQVHEGHFTSESGRNFAWQVPLFNDSFAPVALAFQVLQDGVIASVAPGGMVLPAHGTGVATLHVQVPPAVHGTPAAWVPCSATLVARRADGSLLGGATRLVRIDD